MERYLGVVLYVADVLLFSVQAMEINIQAIIICLRLSLALNLNKQVKLDKIPMTIITEPDYW